MKLILAIVVVAAAPFVASAQIACVLEHCAGALASCEIDSVCRKWSNCCRGCDANDTPCQIRCGDLYKPTDLTSAKIDAFSECVISEHHCVKQTHQKCPLPAPSAVVANFDIASSLTGVWYITRGLNPLFDCFDCQVHNFTYDPQTDPVSKPLHGDLKYNVKVDLNCSSDCKYLPREVHQSFAQDPSSRGHLINHNNSLAEMHYADDWYILYASERAVLIYYCGCNDASCGYSGAVLYTRTPNLSISESEKRKIAAAVATANIANFSFDRMCIPANTFC